MAGSVTPTTSVPGPPKGSGAAAAAPPGTFRGGVPRDRDPHPSADFRYALARTSAVLVVLAVGVLAKLPETVLPISTDTGMYATYARLMMQGSRPYVDFYDVHPPLTYYYWWAV